MLMTDLDLSRAMDIARLSNELTSARRLADSYARSLKTMPPGLGKRTVRAAYLRTHARIRALERALKKKLN